MRAFQVGRDQLIETLFSRVENVAAFLRRHAGVIHQQIETGEFTLRERNQRGPVFARGNIAREDLDAAFRLKTLSGITAIPIGGNDVVGSREIKRNRAADSAAAAGDDRRGPWHQRPASASSIDCEMSSNEKCSMNGFPLTKTVGVLATPRATPSWKSRSTSAARRRSSSAATACAGSIPLSRANAESLSLKLSARVS